MLAEKTPADKPNVDNLDVARALIQALTNVPEPICVLDSKLIVQQANASARRLLGAEETRRISADIVHYLQNRTVNSPFLECAAQAISPPHEPLKIRGAAFHVSDIQIPLSSRELTLLRFMPLSDTEVGRIAAHIHAQLTPRELRIAKCVQQGASTAQIAETLFVSQNTVKTHLKNIHGKLLTQRRAELVALLNRAGNEL